MEDGEELDDFDVGTRGLGQAQAVFQDPRPMAYAVGSVRRQGIVFEDRVDEGFEVHGFGRRKCQCHTKRYPARRATKSEAAVTAASQASKVAPSDHDKSTSQILHAAAPKPITSSNARERRAIKMIARHGVGLPPSAAHSPRRNPWLKSNPRQEQVHNGPTSGTHASGGRSLVLSRYSCTNGLVVFSWPTVVSAVAGEQDRIVGQAEYLFADPGRQLVEIAVVEVRPADTP